MEFEWDDAKNTVNTVKHGVSFYEAQKAFLDKDRLILPDAKHSSVEKRFFCIGRIDANIATVRFTIRNSRIRIIGAGYWREGKKLYEQQ